MSTPGDGEPRRPADRDLDAEIDALARRIERSIVEHRRALAAVELEPLPLTPLDHARSVLSPGGPDADSSQPTGGDADSSGADPP